jgi:O-methyltransferase
VRIARRQSLLLVEDREFLPEDREEGRDWPCFGYTMVGHRRLDNIQDCVETVLRNEIPGDLVETGVWRGGGSIFMRAVLKAHGVTDRRVWAADSFDGFPEPVSNDDTDLRHVQYLKVSLDDVRGAFDRFGLLDDQVRFLPGWFHETLPSAPIERIAVLRLDGDLYSSTMSALRALYSRVSSGGYVIVDDYYSWESCRRAVTEFLEAENLTPNIQRIDWTGAFWRVDSVDSRC